jgi:hypothetical protein
VGECSLKTALVRSSASISTSTFLRVKARRADRVRETGVRGVPTFKSRDTAWLEATKGLRVAKRDGGGGPHAGDEYGKDSKDLGYK